MKRWSPNSIRVALIAIVIAPLCVSLVWRSAVRPCDFVAQGGLLLLMFALPFCTPAPLSSLASESSSRYSTLSVCMGNLASFLLRPGYHQRYSGRRLSHRARDGWYQCPHFLIQVSWWGYSSNAMTFAPNNAMHADSAIPLRFVSGITGAEPVMATVGHHHTICSTAA